MGKTLATPPGTICAGTCGRPLRPGHWEPERAPGTVQHKSRGMCGACLYHSKKADGEPYDLYAPLVVNGYDSPDPGVRRCARELNRWLFERHLRNIPTEGIPHEQP